MRILFIIRNLDSKGGAQKYMLRLVEELIQRGHEVDVSILGDENSPLMYEVPKGANLFYLGGGRKAYQRIPFRPHPQNAKLNLHLRHHQYDVLVGWLKRAGAMVGALPPTFPAARIAAMRNLPYNLRVKGRGFRKSIKHYFLSARFGRADKIFVQSPQFVELMPKKWQDKSVIIPNAVKPRSTPPIAWSSKENLIVAVARLVEVKRLDHLLLGFSQFHKKFPDWKLEIWGQDKECGHHSVLQNIIDREGLSNSAQLMGVSHDIESVYDRARILAHPSQREGMSNSVAEAMAHGLPVIACADCVGITDLLKDGKTGMLLKGETGETPLADQIGDALAHLAANSEEAARMGNNACQMVSEQFSPKTVFDLWETELIKAATMRN